MQAPIEYLYIQKVIVNKGIANVTTQTNPVNILSYSTAEVTDSRSKQHA